MDYIEARITTTRAGVEALTAILEEIAGGFVVEDPQDLEDLLNAPSPRWDYIDEELVARQKKGGAAVVCFYLEEGEQGRLRLEEARARVQALAAQDQTGRFGQLTMSWQSVRSQDWENNWKQYYKPFEIGPRLMVRPSWEQAQAKPGQTILVMDPAGSFGTGSHATTRLCLEALETMDLTGRKMLDAGCGSGILAAAGLLLGAERAVACDVEPSAMRTAAENLAKNQIDPARCELLLGDFLQDQRLYHQLAGQYGVITANIVADVLIAMAPALCAWLAPEGDLLLSGIIDERGDEVLSHYLAQGLAVKNRRSREGWILLHLGREV